MEWTRSETLALASFSCSTCHGLGLRPARGASEEPCACALRKVFRICLNRFRAAVEREKHLSHCTLSYTGGKANHFSWGRKEEEYIADFLLMVQRVLTEDEFTIFRYRYLLGADFKLCMQRLKLERGDLFHALYRIESRLGRAFREMEPYGLFPLEQYFYGTLKVTPPLTPPPDGPRPLYPPMEGRKIYSHRQLLEELDLLAA